MVVITCADIILNDIDERSNTRTEVLSLRIRIDYQKVLIGVSFASGLMSVLALFLTQLLKTNASFHNLSCSKRIIELLLITTILTGRSISSSIEQPNLMFVSFSLPYTSDLSIDHFSLVFGFRTFAKHYLLRLFVLGLRRRNVVGLSQLYSHGCLSY